jgi:hypothetical protein
MPLIHYADDYAIIDIIFITPCHYAITPLLLILRHLRHFIIIIIDMPLDYHYIADITTLLIIDAIITLILLLITPLLPLRH